MSGSTESLWTMSIEPNHLNLAYYMAEQINETKNSFDELVDFLKVVPIENLHWFMFTDHDDDIFEIKLAPVVESKFLWDFYVCIPFKCV